MSGVVGCAGGVRMCGWIRADTTAQVYDIVKIRWTTHRPVGLGGKDVAMAEFCDQEAERAGAVAVPVAAERGDNAAQEQEEKGLLDGLVEGEACGACARKSA